MSAASITAQHLVERSLRMFADRVAVIADGTRTTYRTLDERSARLAGLVRAAGASGDRPVAAWMGNRPEYIELDVACTRAGILRVGIGERLSADEARYILEDSGACVLVGETRLLAQLDAETLASLTVLALGESDGDLPGAAYESALSESSPETTFEPVAPETPNYLLYTSGTTGRPKGATHSQGGRARATLNMLASELRGFGSDAVFLHAGPVTHGSGSKILTTIAAGGANALMPKFSAEAMSAAIIDDGATHSFLVPTMIARLLAAGEETHAAVRRMRQISFGGAPIAKPLFEQAFATFGPILTQVYGTSEQPHPITVLQPEDREEPGALESAGRVAFGVELAILPRDAETPVPSGEGELLIRAPHSMTGYWKNEEASRAVLDDDGWYRSGDVVRIADNGFVTFLDRERDLIVSGGLNVYPSEVERILHEHAAVQMAAVVGAPDDVWGEAVVAYVVPKDAAFADEDALQQHVRQHLAGYKKPQRITFVPELPMNSTGKVLKRELREQLWQGRDRRVG